MWIVTWSQMKYEFILDENFSFVFNICIYSIRIKDVSFGLGYFAV